MVSNLEIISEDYLISTDTVAFLPFRHETLQTKIIDKDGEFYSPKTAVQLLNEACIQDYACYESRRHASTILFNIHQKVPIPVLMREHVYAIPTHSPKHIDCSWIFPHHITYINELHKEATEIYLTTGTKVTVPISYKTFNNQMNRTSRIQAYLSSPVKYSFWLNKKNTPSQDYDL